MITARPAVGAAGTGRDVAGQRSARRHEARLIAAAHPVAWPVARLARRLAPDVCAVPGLGYLVSGAEMLRAIQLDGVRFLKNGPGSTGEVITQALGARALVNMDGPAHAELRRELQPLFTRAGVEGPSAAGHRIATDLLLEPLEQGDKVDLAGVSRIVAAAVVCGLAAPAVALPADELLELNHVATRLANVLSVRVRRLDEDDVRKAHALRDRLLERVDPRATAVHGGETLVGRLRRAGLADDELDGAVAMIMVAGMETTSAAIGRISALLSDLGAWPGLSGDSEAVERAVDEAFRYVSPLLGVTRLVAEDCTVMGRRFRRGALVVGHIHAAVRDPRVIDRGEDFAPDREIPAALRHLWFGAGAHFCVGMPIARAVLVGVVAALADAGGLEIVERRPVRRLLIPTYDRLVVERRPRRARA